jgi:hypothetical protein
VLYGGCSESGVLGGDAMKAPLSYERVLERRRAEREALRARRSCAWLECPTCAATYRDDGGDWCPACRATDEDG